MAVILERSQIAPAQGSAREFSLPIVFFDMVWYGFPANQRVLFFEFPCSKSQFLETFISELKCSLSFTLSQFLPLVGNIIHPLKPGSKPVLRYECGDLVSFTVSESTADFNYLTGNHPRDCDEFYTFAPHLPPATYSENFVSCPILALQVTLFPGQGLCIGFVTHHVVADASTIVSFMQAWALINRSKPNGADNIREILAEANLLPFYNRKAVTNLNGLDLIYWDIIVNYSCPVEPPTLVFSINKLRATLVLKKEEIQKLKNLVLAKCASISHLSSFTIICALTWVCWAKTTTLCGEDVADGSDGIIMAAKAIGDAIKETIFSERGILYGAEKWPNDCRKLVETRQYGPVGSPRFDFYAVDYGWGKPKKFEELCIDGGGCFSVCKSRDFEGGLEIGLSKSRVQMDAFITVFKDVLDG
ncbi:UNVERIFIED_CONTAM: Malonyl-coenzyme:anthocyanin 5-O-glucoside-6'''-O-malonyltransferase [Sesamum radiatum]|uniref:Malonyl-coenzyme:anthocyanin 5-O-glucoside-6'''-O-malonyltransferase n=1 Tax=Sesamum radiatum TaxID=300843 RepID=A0AAW2JHP4_SESRA